MTIMISIFAPIRPIWIYKKEPLSICKFILAAKLRLLTQAQVSSHTQMSMALCRNAQTRLKLKITFWQAMCSSSLTSWLSISTKNNTSKIRHCRTWLNYIMSNNCWPKMCSLIFMDKTQICRHMFTMTLILFMMTFGPQASILRFKITSLNLDSHRRSTDSKQNKLTS